MKETKSTEDYLEAIYVLSQNGKIVHVKDIAQFLSVKLPSVTEALRRFIKSGYIEHIPYGGVILKENGKKIGKETWGKHKLIFSLLKDVLGISEEVAFKEACLMEHYISAETEEKIKEFLKKQKKRPS